MIAAGVRPRLRRGVLLRYDGVRERHVLMYPEGVLVLNGTAADILRHCDGAATVADITATLRLRYQDVRDDDVADVLDRLVGRGMIEVDRHG